MKQRRTNELENRLIQLLEQNGVWAWEYDMERREITRYPFLKGSTYGYQEETIRDVPRSVVNRGMIHKDDIDTYLQVYDRLDNGENQVVVQVRGWIEERGEYVWQELTATVLHDEEGKRNRVLFSGRDISDKKQLELRFVVEDRYWEALSASMLATGRRNLTTGRWEETTIHGMPVTLPEKIQQAGDYRSRAEYFLLEVDISESDNERLMPQYLMEQYAQGESSISVEFGARTMEAGEVIRVKVDCRMIKRPDTGDMIAYYYESDITQEFCMRNIMDAIINYEYDLVGVLFVETNSVYSQAKEQHKTSLPELVTNNYDQESETFLWRYARSENMQELVESMKMKRILQGLESREAYIVEFDVREPSGEFRRKEMRFAYVNRATGIIAISRRDVQETIQMEQVRQAKLLHALNMAEQANNAKSEFLSRMSHEMRTPMNAIVGLTALAQQETDHPEAVADYLEKIKVSSRLLMNLINDVLDMAKIENGKMELHAEVCPVEALTEGIGTIILPLCEQKQIRFVHSDVKSQVMVRADRMRFQQVIINLLSNAVKFTPEGGTVCFRSECRKQAGFLLVETEVSDNGAGMSEEFQKQMFHPFTQEQRTGVLPVQGTGLGLAISKAIIDKMGGTIQVDSHLGAGTRFIVRVKFPLAEETTTGKKKELEAKKNSQENLMGSHILLVEDHPMNQLIARRILQNNGAQVVTVGNGSEAVELFRRGEADVFDAVLMDIRMPVMDGLTATKIIRGMPEKKAKSIPIIAMTANAFDEDVKNSRAAGMNYHLAKPIDPALLIKTLQECIHTGVPAGE